MIPDNTQANPGSPLPDPSIEQLHFPKSVLTVQQDELDIELHEINGKALPIDLHGYVFIVAALFPAKKALINGILQSKEEQQVYNGDGIIYRLGFDRTDETVTAHLKTRIAKPPCYYADQMTQQRKKYESCQFHNAGFARLGRLGSRNQLNTAFAKYDDRLFITFDAGRPCEIDSVTLEILEPVGETKEWLSPVPNELTGAMFFSPYQTPAHPVSDGKEFFTANYSTGLSRLLPAVVRENLSSKIKQRLQGYTDLIRWTGGSLERWRLTLKNGDPVIIEQSLHQMAITKDYLVLVDIAFSTEVSQLFAPFIVKPWIEKLPTKALKRWLKAQIMRLRKQLPFTNVYLVARSDLDNQGTTVADQPELNQNSLKTLIVKKIVLPREVSHFVADYSSIVDNDEDHLVLHTAHNNAWDVTEWIRDWDEPGFPLAGLRTDLEGMIVGPVDISFLGRYVINAHQGTLVEAKVVCDPEATWSVSLYTYPETQKSSIQTIYWLAWGFYRELVPKRIYDAYKNYRYRGVAAENLTTSRDECEDKPSYLLKLNTATSTIDLDRYCFPSDRFPSSPQFVPKASNSEEGYIVCTVVSDHPSSPDSTGDEVWIFDAQQLSKGPQYRLAHPRLDFGLTIHTEWLSDIKQRHSETEAQKLREETFDQDYTQVIQQLADEKEKKFPNKAFFAELRAQFIGQKLSVSEAIESENAKPRSLDPTQNIPAADRE